VVWVPFGAAYWPAKLISCSQGSHNQATVELFGTGLKTEVDASRLAAFADGCADKCQQLHSELGRQVSWLMQMARVCVRACVCICVCVCVCMCVMSLQQSTWVALEILSCWSYTAEHAAPPE